MRCGKVHFDRARARVQSQTNWQALAYLKSAFRSAATPGNMGKKWLNEMDRAASIIVSQMIAVGRR